MAFLLPKPRPRILDKRDEARERLRIVREVYRLVAERDRRRCRCCGRSGSYESTASEKALHRHHLVYHSKQGADVSGNLISVCAVCHALIHARQLWAVGMDADRLVRFEIHEAAVIDVFGTKPLPRHVSMVTERRRA